MTQQQFKIIEQHIKDANLLNDKKDYKAVIIILTKVINIFIGEYK